MYVYQNQVDYLVSKNIKASSLNSKTLAAERASIISDLSSKKPSTKLLYVTPEMCTQTFFQVIFFKYCYCKLFDVSLLYFNYTYYTEDSILTHVT